MDIPQIVLIEKMEELLHKAKHSAGEEQGGYLIAVKSLIELIAPVGQKDTVHQAAESASYKTIIPKHQGGSPSLSEQPVKMDDANGDSLLDF